MPKQKQWSAGEEITAAKLNKTGNTNFWARQQSTPNMTLYVEDGVANIQGTIVKYASGNSPTFVAPTSNPRIDLLCINNAGTLSVVQGTEAASPSAPTYPSDKLVICEIYLRVSTTALYNDDQGSNGYIYKNTLPFSVPSAAPIGFSKVAEVSAGATVQELNITGLDLDADFCYFIIAKLANTSALAQDIDLFVNGDTTHTNYKSRRMSTAGDASGNDGLVGKMSGNSGWFFEGKMARPAGNGYPKWSYQSERDGSIEVGLNFKEVNANVTQIKLRADGGNYIASGSKMVIYKASL